MPTFTHITTPEVDVPKLRETTVDLLETLIYGDTAPFKDMKEVLEDYLDTAIELDATQKAGLFVGTMRDLYKDINSQVISAAIEIQKVNTSLELEKYTAEGTYNTLVNTLPKIDEEVKLVAAQVLKTQKETEILGKEEDLKDAQLLEMLAKLKKQYGVQETSVGSGVIENTSAPGAIDKQIAGYDKVNLKDTLKTLDERAALMQNAKIPETAGEKALRSTLIHAITGYTLS